MDNVRVVEKAVGKVSYGLTEREKQSKVFRRSLFAVKDIKKGETFTQKNVRSIRPGYGLAPKYLNEILGRKAKVHFKKGSPINWDIIE